MLTPIYEFGKLRNLYPANIVLELNGIVTITTQPYNMVLRCLIYEHNINDGRLAYTYIPMLELLAKHILINIYNYDPILVVYNN